MAERLSEKFEIRPWQEGDDLALLEIWNSARNEVEERQRGLSARIRMRRLAAPWW